MACSDGLPPQIPLAYRRLMFRCCRNPYMYAIPPEVLVLLEGMLPDDQYRTLVERTRSLAGLDRR